MLEQHRLIERVRSLCDADLRIEAALIYGSFVKGEGDKWSDIEFWCFVEDEALSTIDRQAWCEAIAPTLAVFLNEYGSNVAIFASSLIRGEFHFHPASNLEIVSTWRYLGAPPEKTVIVDRKDRLGILLAPETSTPSGHLGSDDVRTLCLRFVNWMLFGHNVLMRGELARAHLNLTHGHVFLQQMVRVAEDRRDHWLTPSKGWEQDVSERSVARFTACTAPAIDFELHRAYGNTWLWGRSVIAKLDGRFSLGIEEALLSALDDRLGNAMKNDTDN